MPAYSASAKDICFIGTQPSCSCQAGISPDLEVFFRVSLESAFAVAPLGRTAIALDKVPYDTASNSWVTGVWLGNITLKIEGTITKHENGRLSFNGGARAYNDIYDANTGTWRTAIGENATSVLAAVEKYLNAKPYEIAIQGTNVIAIDR
ncbi:lipid II-degrading bacteriocin [Pseudomonas sp. RT4P38]